MCQVIKDETGYFILTDNIYYYQRGYVFNATDKPLDGQEEIIIALCKLVLGGGD